MEFLSFCVLNETLYMCTSGIGDLLAILKARGLDYLLADQGRIHHTSPEDYLIICSPSTEILVKDTLKNILKGRLHFEGASIESKNKKLKKINCVDISEDVYINILNLVMECRIGEEIQDDNPKYEQ